MATSRATARAFTLRSDRFMPSTTMVPESGTSRPLMQRISTLLPEPDGPMTTTFSASATSRDTPLSASTVPKLLYMSLTEIAFATAGPPVCWNDEKNTDQSSMHVIVPDGGMITEA